MRDQIFLSKFRYQWAAAWCAFMYLTLFSVLSISSYQRSDEAVFLGNLQKLEEFFSAADQTVHLAKSRSYISHQGQQTNEVVLLVHGFTDGPYTMTELARAYEQMGKNVVVVRLPGHGISVDAIVTANLDEHEAFLAKAINMARPLGKNLHLVGFSFGGGLSALVAEKHQNRVDRMTLLAPAIGVNKKIFDYLSLPEAMIHRLAVRLYPDEISKHPRLLEIIKFGTSTTVELEKRLEKISSLSIPTEIFFLEADSTVNNRKTEKFYKEIIQNGLGITRIATAGNFGHNQLITKDQPSWMQLRELLVKSSSRLPGSCLLN